jgi:cytochrome P450
MFNSTKARQYRQIDGDKQIRRKNSGLPPTLPLPSLVETGAFWRAPHSYLDLCHRRLGRSFTIYPFGAAPMVFMSNPADIAAIIRSQPDVLQTGAGAEVITPLVGRRSFMLQEGEDHIKIRRAVMSAFRHRVVAKHAEAVQQIAAKDIASWPVGRSFAAHPYLRALTLRVILNTIFGDEDPRLSELHACLFKMLSVTGSLALQEPPLRRLPPWRGLWRSFLLTRDRVDHLIGGLVEDGAHKAAESGGLLDELLAAHSREGPISEHIHDDLMSVILAGHETTASQLAWALQLLAHNPAASSALTAEVDRTDNAYLTATVQEVMRHRPVFLFAIPRVVSKPTEIAGSLYVPCTQLAACIHLLHHDPELYRQPRSFLPERFIDSPPDPRFWLPWGGGRKRCPGHNLATLEMQIVLREVVSQRCISPANNKLEAARWRSVIITPGSGCQIVLDRRNARRSGRIPR